MQSLSAELTNNEAIEEIIEMHTKWLESGGKESSRAVFMHVNFNSMDFSNFNISGAVFKNCNLSGSVFKKVSGATFSSCNLMNTHFKLNLDSVIFEGSNLQDANFSHLKIINGHFFDCEGLNLNFIFTKIKNTNFEKCNFKNINFFEANINESFVLKSILTNGVFSKTSFIETQVNGCDFKNALFDEVNIFKSNFVLCKIDDTTGNLKEVINNNAISKHIKQNKIKNLMQIGFSVCTLTLIAKIIFTPFLFSSKNLELVNLGFYSLVFFATSNLFYLGFGNFKRISFLKKFYIHLFYLPPFVFAIFWVNSLKYENFQISLITLIMLCLTSVNAFFKALN